jgi:hypothetical protein
MIHQTPLTEIWDKLRPAALDEFKRQLGMKGYAADEVTAVAPFEMQEICEALDAFNKQVFDRIQLWDHPELFPAVAGETDNQPF